MKSVRLNLLEPSGPVQACTGIALLYSVHIKYYIVLLGTSLVRYSQCTAILFLSTTLTGCSAYSAYCQVRQIRNCLPANYAPQPKEMKACRGIFLCIHILGSCGVFKLTLRQLYWGGKKNWYIWGWVGPRFVGGCGEENTFFFRESNQDFFFSPWSLFTLTEGNKFVILV
jgi:hypothetical protein